MKLFPLFATDHPRLLRPIGQARDRVPSSLLQMVQIHFSFEVEGPESSVILSGNYWTIPGNGCGPPPVRRGVRHRGRHRWPLALATTRRALGPHRFPGRGLWGIAAPTAFAYLRKVAPWTVVRLHQPPLRPTWCVSFSEERVEIDSTELEDSIRTLALNRKNALFVGRNECAAVWEYIASLRETAKMGDVQPSAWLTTTQEAHRDQAFRLELRRTVYCASSPTSA